MPACVFEWHRDIGLDHIASTEAVLEVLGLWSGTREPEFVHRTHLPATMSAGLDAQGYDALRLYDLRCRATHTSRIQPVSFWQTSLCAVELSESTTTTLHSQATLL